MLKTVLYLAALAVAAVLVFFATYFLGRNSSLEAELERLTAPRAVGDNARSQGIPSLQPIQVPPEMSTVPQVLVGEPLGDGIQVTRTPLESSGLVIVVDLPALGASPAGSGLAAFLARPPAGLKIGLRSLAGAPDECGATAVVREPGSWAGGDLASALVSASGTGLGPRNPAGAVEGAADDLRPVSGDHAVVVIAGGEEGCDADLCGFAAPPGGLTQRVHVLLLASPPPADSEPGMPGVGSAGTLPPVFEPAWAASYRCLAERSGGTLAVASSAVELESRLRHIAGHLESAIVVKAFHYTGQEVQGISPGGTGGWGATLRLGRAADAGVRTLESEIFPTLFAVPAGVYVVQMRYGGQERTAAVAVAAGERAEVRVAFATGELYLQALSAAGGEVVGDSAGFGCAWGVDVFTEGGEDVHQVAGTCSFPARIELAPGSYRVRARWKGVERVVENVTIEAGASVVRAVSFVTDNE